MAEPMMRSVIVSLAAFAFLTGASLVACGSSKHGFDDPNGPGNGSSNGGTSGGDGGGGAFDTSKEASASPRPPVVGWLHGKVVAPEGTIPVSNALIYLTDTLPDAIPIVAYCDTCVHL